MLIFSLTLLLTNGVFSAEPARVAQGAFRFTDVTAQAGVCGLERYGGHGIAWADLDGDSWDDAYTTNIFDPPPLPDLLYVNQRDGSFRECARERGVQDLFSEGSHGVAFGDIDADGDYDVFNGTTGSSDHLYLNDGRGYFTDVSDKAGIAPDPTLTRGVLFADFDGDGDLDLFTCTPASVPWKEWEPKFPLWDGPTNIPRLYMNRGDGTFSRDDRGVPFVSFEQGCTAADFDQDGDEDLFVCRWRTPSLLYRNDGKGYFSACSREVGLPSDDDRRINGATFGDVDNDGDLDLIMGPSGERGGFCETFLNDGTGHFHSLQTLSALGFTPMLADLDNDGDLDLYTGTNLFSNDGRGRFQDVPLGGMSVPFNDPRCSAATDFDHDGDLDVFLVCKRSQNYFFRNETNNRNWLKVKLIGRNGVAGAFGAYVWVYDSGHAGDKSHLRGTRYPQSAFGYLGQHSPVLHFGVDAAKHYDLRVRFLDGKEAILTNIAAGTTVLLRHPSAPVQ